MAWVNGSGSTPAITYIHTQLEPDWLLHMYVRKYVCMYVCIRIVNTYIHTYGVTPVVHGGGHGYLQGLPKQPNCLHGSCFQPPSLAVSPKVSLVQEGLILLCPHTLMRRLG